MTFDPAKYYADLQAAGAASVPPSLEEQTALARAELIRQKQQNDEIANWSVLNANLQHHQLAARAAGLDPMKSVIPFGSTNTTITYPTAVLPQPAQQPAAPAASSGLKTAAAVGLSALLGAGGFGAASYLSTPPAAVEQPEQEYEWVLEVERGVSGSIGSTGDGGRDASAGQPILGEQPSGDPGADGPTPR